MSKAQPNKKRLPNKTDNNKQLMLERLEFHLGIVSRACNDANISRTTHYEWIENDPDYARAVNDIGETALDVVESELFRQIKDGNVTAIIFYLKTKGKKRGYIEKLGIDFTNQTAPDLSELTTEQIVSLLDESHG